MIIPAEDTEKVAGQIVLVRVAKAADNGAVHRDVGGVGWVCSIDKNIARMHVRVKEAVAKHLGEENLYTAFTQYFEVGTFGSQCLHVRNWNPADALHGEYIAAGVVPIHLGYIDQITVFEIAPQLAGVGGLSAQVQFIEDNELVV